MELRYSGESPGITTANDDLGAGFDEHCYGDSTNGSSSTCHDRYLLIQITHHRPG